MLIIGFFHLQVIGNCGHVVRQRARDGPFGDDDLQEESQQRSSKKKKNKHVKESVKGSDEGL